MAIKGYCSNTCLGMTVLGSGGALLAGLAMIAVGVVVWLDPMTVSLTLQPLAYLAIPTGILLLTQGILGLIGGCKESKGSTIAAAVLAILIIGMLGGVLAICFVKGSKPTDKMRTWYHGQPEQEKIKVEQSSLCCGFDAPSESPQGKKCVAKRPCVKPLTALLKGKFSLPGAIVAIALVIEIIVLMGTSCICRMMKREERKVVGRRATAIRDVEAGKSRKDRRVRHNYT